MSAKQRGENVQSTTEGGQHGPCDVGSIIPLFSQSLWRKGVERDSIREGKKVERRKKRRQTRQAQKLGSRTG